MAVNLVVLEYNRGMQRLKIGYQGAEGANAERATRIPVLRYGQVEENVWGEINDWIIPITTQSLYQVFSRKSAKYVHSLSAQASMNGRKQEYLQKGTIMTIPKNMYSMVIPKTASQPKPPKGAFILSK